MKTKQNKIIVAMSAVIVLLVALSATLTFAWFTASSQVSTNQMTFGKLALDITGLQDSKLAVNTDGNTTKLVPGDTLTPQGTITVTTNNDAYLRYRYQIEVSGVKIAESIVDDPETTDVDERTEAQANANAAAVAEIKNLFANVGSTNGENTFISGQTSDVGYTPWYYTKVVAGNGTTAQTVLSLSRTAIKLTAGDFGNKYQEATVTLKLFVEAIQAQHLTYIDESDNDTVKDVTVTIDTTDPTKITILGTLESASAWGTANDENDGVEDND